MSPPASEPALAVCDGELVGLDEARVAVTDDGWSRGDGAFEAVGVWGGRPFRLDDHIARLAASQAAIGLVQPDDRALRADLDALLSRVGAADAVVRIYLTASGTRVVTLTGQPDRAPLTRLAARLAPWIAPRDEYEAAGAKTMSYAHNMAATRSAQRAGADDALLVSAHGTVLEGPTFCVVWVAGGVVCTPPLALGIVDSITRRTLLELAAEAGYATEETRATVEDLAAAEEVMVCSAVRRVTALAALEGHPLPSPSPAADRLSAAMDARRRAG